jgi:hypothetical protein
MLPQRFRSLRRGNAYIETLHLARLEGQRLVAIGRQTSHGHFRAWETQTRI